MEIFGLIILLGILLVDYYLFIKLNSKFIDKYPQYSGKFLWTLFFFPIMFQVSIFLWEIVTILSIFSFTSLSDEVGINYVDKMLIRTLRNWSIISIFIFGVASYFIYRCRLSLNNILFNWEERKKEEAIKQMSIIIGIGVIAPIIYSIGSYFSIYNNEWLWLEIKYKFGDDQIAEMVNSILMSFMLMLAIGSIIWFFSKKKINSMSETLGSTYNFDDENKVVLTPELEINQTTNNSINKLKDLKQLLDEGVLSEEEFSKMKKEILKAGF